MSKIQVTQPTFLINLDNPTEVSYVPMEGNWKSIIVETYQHGFPEIQDNEILYVYKENRGYIKKQQVMTEEKTLVVDPDEVFTIDKYYSTKYLGYYQLGGSEGVQIYLAKKPKWLHRKMMELCLGLKWINN